MISVAAAFVFAVWSDPMTDQKTWQASVGDDRASVTILCGSITGGKPAVSFQTSTTLYKFGDQRASVQWRFDDGKPEKRWGNWFGDRATLVGKDAELFISQITVANRLRAQLAGAFDDDVFFDTPISDPRDAIGAVLKSCAAQ